MLKKIFFTIQNLFHSYSNLGVVKNLRIEEKQSIRLINILGAIPIIIYFYFIYYGFKRAYYFPVYMGIALVLAEMLGIYVNALGKYITAKLIIFCVNSFAVFFIYNSINIDYSTVCYFFPILMAYEITFDIKKEIKYFLITFLFTLVCIILFFVIPKGAFFFCILPPDLVKETIILNYTFPLIISAVFLILIIKTHSKTRDKLIIARKQSDNANKVKSQFLSNMSHELKTPINGILGLTNLLMHENLSAQAAEYVKALHYSSTQLSSLVSDILDFSTIESDNIIFEEKMFDLNKVCTHVFDLFKEQAHKKNIGCFFNKLPIQCNVTGDPTRLQQVLSNLISNAIKFTEVRGIVTFSCNIKDDVNNKINIEFIIKDTGIGIAPDQDRRAHV